MNTNHDEQIREVAPSGDEGAILTYSGMYINPLNPDPSAIRIIDIAHALGNNCRYGGHCPRFYSVAEHSLLVRNLMKQQKHDPIVLFAALMHDAEEAYMLDMPTPVKVNFPSYIDACNNLRKVIWDVFQIPYELYEVVKPFDNEAYFQERKRLWTKGSWHTYKPLEAKNRFLESFRIYATMFAKAELSGSVGTEVEVA